MARVEESIFIIGNNEERSRKLLTIMSFIGETCYLVNYRNWRSLPYEQVRVVVVAAAGEKLIPFLEELAELAPKAAVILIDYPHVQEENSFKNVHARLQFPFTYSQMMEALHKCQIAQEYASLEGEFKQRLSLFRSLVGKSEPIRQVRKLITQVADTEASVLILGESGTGKEVVARNIHALSSTCLTLYSYKLWCYSW